jgi:hypothetical protein
MRLHVEALFHLLLYISTNDIWLNRPCSLRVDRSVLSNFIITKMGKCCSSLSVFVSLKEISPFF